MKSQYTDSITGEIVCNIQNIDNNLYFFSSDYKQYKISTVSLDSDSMSTYPDPSTPNQIIPITKNFTSSITKGYDLINDIFRVLYKRQILIDGDLTVSFWYSMYQDHTTYDQTNLFSGFSTTISTSAGSQVIGFFPRTKWNSQSTTIIGTSISSREDFYNTQVNLNDIYHIAIVKHNSTFTIYINGTKHFQHSKSGSIIMNGIQLGSTKCAKVSFADLVIIKDQALWTSNFDIPNYYLLGDMNIKDKSCTKITPFILDSCYFDKVFLY